MNLVELTLHAVPNECVQEIKQIAAIAVDRYYKRTDEIIDPITISASNTKKDNFRVANGMAKEYNPEP